MASQPVLIFDGYCNLCSGIVGFLIRIDSKRLFRFVAGQSAEGIALLKRYQLTAPETVVLIQDDTVFTESEAVLNLLGRLNAPWRWMKIFSLLPASFRDKLYHLVARYRYRIFGKRKGCFLP